MCEDAFSLPRGTLPFMSGLSVRRVHAFGADTIDCECACVSEYVRTSVGIGSSRTRLRNYACRRSAVTDSTVVSVIIIGYVLLL